MHRGAGVPSALTAPYVELATLFETSAFRAIAAFDRDRSVHVTLVEAIGRGPEADAALDRLYRAHASPPHPAIAHAIARVSDSTSSLVVFDLPAVTDLDGVVRFAAEARVKARHDEADGLVVTLRDALLASARAPGRHPADRHLGTVAMGNVLFGMDGRFALLGLGHNVAACDTEGRLVARTRFFHAPEIAMGGAPTEQSDFVALLLLVRGMLAFVSVDETITRVITGNTLTEDLELARHVLFVERRVVHASPSARASIEETIATSDRIRALVGVKPDPEGFVRRVAALLRGALGPRLVPTDGVRRRLRISSRGTWLELHDGPRVDLSRRAVLGRTLLALARARVASPGRGLDVGSLAAVCWPGERIRPDAAANRVYVAVSSLRRLGLGADLEHTDRGYRLAQDLECELVEDLAV